MTAFSVLPVIRHQFPDLQWLKRQIGQTPGHPRGPGEKAPAGTPWPTVILNVTTRQAVRPDIRGPLSIFTNLGGESYVSVDHRRVRVDEQFYFISNQDEHYSLEIDTVQPVRTFNIHFGQQFTEQFYDSLVLPAGQLLEKCPDDRGRPVSFFGKLYRRDALFNAIVGSIRRSHQSGIDALLFDEQLCSLLRHLVGQHRQLEKELHRLPPVKRITRLEIYRRLSVAVDYLYTYYDRNLTLDELAGVACLSKFHFLRLFKAAFGRSPHQFLIGVRLEKGRQLLRHSKLPVGELALLLGFPDASSFSRSFYRAHHVYPIAYREKV